MQQYDKTHVRAVIGLGNPGSKYHRNRHNIGFRVVDVLADVHHASWQTVGNLMYAQIRPTGLEQGVHLIKPQTFMNSSGQALSWLTKKGIKPEQIVVVHDELEKKFGQLVLKLGGSHKGHNGLKSLMGVVGPDFWRLKFGIDRPVEREEVPDYVLANFPPDEESQIPVLIDKAIGLLGL
ncbi:aminoacyl-tRNA hydrolase [bacterium]|nr:aminoacyl-tRNA hydrolase [bacterium]